MPDPDVRRIVLVGFMGSGKTTIGEALAAALHWRFEDLDLHIQALDGRDIPTIFRDSGEARFRAMEAEVGARLLSRDGIVLATGGGWAAAAGRLDALPPGTVSVWLRVSPEEAVRRAAAEPGARPLLADPDPLTAARRLLERREPRYARADFAVDTDGVTPERVTNEVLALVERGPAHHHLRQERDS
ncbi:MAG: shikimate kinase [Gemmatimonadota bacterium]|jgi:shikimate kinase